jgi:hypothetical protein
VRDLNRAWLERLMAAASSPAGLAVLPEPEPEKQVPVPASRRRSMVAA